MKNQGSPVPENREASLLQMKNDQSFRELSIEWMRRSIEHRYNYQFDWLGRPIIQYPQDMVAVQEIIWRTKPDCIIETGIAHGGSIIYSASMLELLGNQGHVIAIDIDIRQANRDEIEKHPLFKRVTFVEGSSIDDLIAKQVHDLAKNYKNVLILLDSNHTHDHVLRELQLYSPLVTKGNYIVVFDTIIEDMPKGFYPNRPWDVGNNPKTAVHAFLKENKRFEIDHDIDAKLQISFCHEGYLRCVS